MKLDEWKKLTDSEKAEVLKDPATKEQIKEQLLSSSDTSILAMKAEELAEALKDPAFCAEWNSFIDNANNYILDTDTIEELKAREKYIADLIPFISSELRKAAGNTEYNNVTIEDVLNNTEVNGSAIDPKSKFAYILERAKESQLTAVKISSVTTPETTLFLTDKIHKSIFLDDNKPSEDNFNIIKGTINTNPADKKKRKAGAPDKTIGWYIDFRKLKDTGIIPADMTIKDLNLLVDTYTLAEVNEGYTTATQIYKYQHPNCKTVPVEGIKEINRRLTKLSARLWISNTKEHEFYPNYPLFKYDTDILHFERVTAVINGKVTDSAIHVLKKPAIIEIAEQRKQITTINSKLITAIPMNRTEAVDTINNYLIGRISTMKNQAKESRKILLSTIYQQCKIEGKEKQRAPDKIKKLLNHYIDNEYIAAYKWNDSKGYITIELEK